MGCFGPQRRGSRGEKAQNDIHPPLVGAPRGVRICRRDESLAYRRVIYERKRFPFTSEFRLQLFGSTAIPRRVLARSQGKDRPTGMRPLCCVQARTEIFCRYNLDVDPAHVRCPLPWPGHICESLFANAAPALVMRPIIFQTMSAIYYFV